MIRDAQNSETATQARAIVQLVLDPRLQARVAEHPEAFAERFGFCEVGRELLHAGIALRAGLGDPDRFARVLRTAAVAAGAVLASGQAVESDADPR